MKPGLTATQQTALDFWEAAQERGLRGRIVIRRGVVEIDIPERGSATPAKPVNVEGPESWEDVE